MKKVDEKLWEEVQRVVSETDVDQFGFIGMIDDNEVWAVDGNEVKTRPDKPGSDKPHMDFVEGDNDAECNFVREEFGEHVLLVDGRLDKECWPYVLYHEAFERRLMEKGWSYNKAHEAANAGERQLRRQADAVPSGAVAN